MYLKRNVRQCNHGERKYFWRLEVIHVSDELISILCLVMHVLWLLSGFCWRRQAGYPGPHFASSKNSQEKTWPLREGSRLAVWMLEWRSPFHIAYRILRIRLEQWWRTCDTRARGGTHCRFCGHAHRRSSTEFFTRNVEGRWARLLPRLWQSPEMTLLRRGELV